MKLQQALNDPIWITHKKENLYTMDNKPDLWKLVYYPLFQDGFTGDEYDEPRALMQNIDKPGFWHKEVPLRYLTLSA